MGRAFEYRKAAKLKRWGHMAKTFTRLGKQIAIAVKAGGPEPENNPTLRSVIATCKRENMPKDNIDRAIKNAMGKDQSDYKGMTYEGYGPHGIAVFVDTLTDNTTRTVADVRSVFNKFGGNLGTMGSLAFLFDHKCMFTFKKKDGTLESRIVPTLAPGSIVTDTRANIHWLVTEYGKVNLKGLSTWQKTEAIISVAHPQFRDQLIAEAEKMHIWRASNKR